MQNINQDTQIYTGLLKDGYFLFLPLQFYYGDKELHSWYTNWVSLSQSLNSQASKPLQSVSPLFLSEKLLTLGYNEVLKQSLYTHKEAPAKKGKTNSVAHFKTTPGTAAPTHRSCAISGYGTNSLDNSINWPSLPVRAVFTAPKAGTAALSLSLLYFSGVLVPQSSTKHFEHDTPTLRDGQANNNSNSGGFQNRTKCFKVVKTTFWLYPFATNLALYQSMLPSAFNLNL